MRLLLRPHSIVPLPSANGERSVLNWMRNINDWLAEYGASHQNPTNKALHWICVPPIVLTALGFIASLPVPAAILALWPAFNWMLVVILAGIIYYWLLSPPLALGMIPVVAIMVYLLALMTRLPWPLWLTSLAIFIVAWIGQFIGHQIEGKRPSFFKDLQFLLIGPLWLLAFVYRAFHWRYDLTNVK
jgi:uncharacterized membrane protein YGL010W